MRHVLFLVTGFLAGVGMMRVMQRRESSDFDTQFTGNFPRNEGAISAVTGGPPEDMNGMPAQAI